MKAIIVSVLALFFGAVVSLDKAKGDATVALAYAVVANPQVKSNACKCVDCKCDDCPKDCASDTTKIVPNPRPKPVWEFFRDGNYGEHRLVEAGKVVRTVKYKLVTDYQQSCDGSSCRLVPIGKRWVQLK